MNAPTIETRDLTKHYGHSPAVDGLTLRIGPGEIYGFLGLNGAGKSTTIRMLLGMIRPSEGAAYLCGTRIAPGSGPWDRVGFLVDAAHAYPGLTVRENLDLARRLRGVPMAAVEKAVDLLGIAAYRDRRADTLSQGNAQRLGLAKALVHQPDVLILDEPTSGLDPAGIVELRELLRVLAVEHGVTVFVSSHNLAEVTRLTTRVGIIDHGRLLSEIDTEDLAARARCGLIVDARNRDAARRTLHAHGYRVRDAGKAGLEVADAPALARPEHVASLLADASTPPTSLYVRTEDLEALFLRLLAEHRGAAA